MKEQTMKTYKKETHESFIIDNINCDVCNKKLKLHEYYNYHFYTLRFNDVFLEDVIRDVCYECGNNPKALKKYKEKLSIEMDKKYNHLKGE